MNTPKVTRPHFPPGYVDKPKTFLTWEQVASQVAESKHYWLCSVRPNGRPHVIPRWGAFLDDKFYYDGSPETRHAQNILQNPHVTLNLENGEQAIFMEGMSKPAGKPNREFAKRLAKAIGDKYKDRGYSPKPDQWDNGGLYVFTPRQCIAWSQFNEDPTKFIFDEE